MELSGLLGLLEVNQLRKNAVQWFNIQDFGAKGDVNTFDDVAIQNALNAAKEHNNNTTNGYSVVYAPKGTYRINNYLKIASNTMLLCDKNAKFDRGRNDLNLMLTNDSDGITGGYDANENIAIIGGIWDGRKDFYTGGCTIIGFGHAKNILIRDVIFEDINDWHMVEINGCKNVKVQDCYFRNYGTNGATAVGSEMLQIDLMLNSGVFPWFGPYDKTVCDHVLVENCLFENGTDGVGTHSADFGILHNDIKIINNRFYNLMGTAVKGYNWQNTLVEGNHIELCDFGVKYTVTTTTISKNHRIVNNNFYKLTKSSNARAIQIVSVDDTSYIGHGVINGNTVDDVDRHGITMDHSRDWIISNNSIRDVAQVGIYVYGGHDNVVLGNVSRSNGTMGLQIGYAGTTKRAKNVNVQGNTIDTMQIGNAENCLISNNVFTTLTRGGDLINVTTVNNLVNGVYA